MTTPKKDFDNFCDYLQIHKLCILNGFVDISALYLLIGGTYTSAVDQNFKNKSGHVGASLVKVIGSYTSLAFYSNRKNMTNVFQIQPVLSNDNEHLSSLENSPSAALIQEGNSNSTTFKNINQQHFANDNHFFNNYSNHNNTNIDKSKILETHKLKEMTKHYHELQSPKSKTKKKPNYFTSIEDYLVDALDLNSPNLNALPDKLNPIENKLKTLNPNILHVLSAPMKSKQRQSDSFYAKNSYLTPAPKNDFLKQEKFQNLSLYINEDVLETNELDDILSVPQTEVAKLRPLIETVEAVNIDSRDHSATFGQHDQAVKWTPLEQAVTWKPRDQAVKPGPWGNAVNWNRQDQQQTSGTS